MYNITLRSVRATIVAIKGNKYYIFWVCVCSLRYPACYAHAPYCHLWHVCSAIFSHIIPLTERFSKKNLWNIKCVFRVSLQLFQKHFSF